MHLEPTEKELRLARKIAANRMHDPILKREILEGKHDNTAVVEIALAALRAERELAAKWLDEAGEEPGHRFRNTPLRNSAIALRNQEHLP